MGKIIDIFTGKEIPDDPKLTVTQSLTKSAELFNKGNIDFNDLENNNWDEVRQSNGVLTPSEVIDEFSRVLTSILNNEKPNLDYCAFMLEQCKHWEISDQFTTIENANSNS